MFDIEFIVPYRDLLSSVLEAYEEFPAKEEIHLDIKIMNTDEVKQHTFFGQAIIARGLTAQYIKNLGLSQPLIEIPTSGYDVIKAISTGLKKFECSHIAFIGTADMIYGAEELGLFFNCKITVHQLNNDDDVDAVLRECKQDGADLFIGGNWLYNKALEAGFNSVRVESGKEAIRQALNESLRAVAIWHQERERAQRFKMLVDHVHEGIISTDRNGNITVINNDAIKLLKLSPRSYSGRHIEEVVKEIKFSEYKALDVPTFGELLRVNNTSLTMNWIPIVVNKSVSGHLLTLQNVSRIQEIESRIRRKAHRKGLVAHYSFKDIIGESKTMSNTLSLARQYSKVDSNVLIVGETGTGKELFAQSIHRESICAEGPFVAINCAALPPSLLESELFGYVEGAFTGASKGGKIGLFELAHQGTIFLDEIAELSPFLQGRLLRVLEEREIMRLGHDEVIPVNIRVIAATNKNLHLLVEQQLFREDLLYRLDVLRLNIPPVRERGKDIVLLISYFLTSFRQRARKGAVYLDTECWNYLINQRWDGNVRQIRNFSERLCVTLEKEHASLRDVKEAYETDTIKVSTTITQEDSPDTNGIKEAIIDLEKELIQEVLRSSSSREEAAKVLGIDRTTLWRKMKRLNITE